MSHTSIRHHMVLVEALSPSFNVADFFRRFNMAALEFKKLNRDPNADPKAKGQIVQSMMSMAKAGEATAKNLPPEDRLQFAEKLRRVVANADLPIKVPEPSTPEERRPVRSGPEMDAPPAAPQGGGQRQRSEGAPLWNVVQLAYKDDGGTRRVFGIAEEGPEYFVFFGKVGEKFKVDKANDLNSARDFFARAIRGGYKETSPANYSKLRAR